MESKHHVDDALRVGGGAEHLPLVVLERFQPTGDIAGVLRDADLDAMNALFGSARSSSIA
jgi:hypothetical protein